MKSETTSPGQSYVEKVVSADFFGPRKNLFRTKVVSLAWRMGSQDLDTVVNNLW